MFRLYLKRRGSIAVQLYSTTGSARRLSDVLLETARKGGEYPHFCNVRRKNENLHTHTHAVQTMEARVRACRLLTSTTALQFMLPVVVCVLLFVPFGHAQPSGTPTSAPVTTNGACGPGVGMRCDTARLGARCCRWVGDWAETMLHAAPVNHKTFLTAAANTTSAAPWICTAAPGVKSVGGSAVPRPPPVRRRHRRRRPSLLRVAGRRRRRRRAHRPGRRRRPTRARRPSRSLRPARPQARRPSRARRRARARARRAARPRRRRA